MKCEKSIKSSASVRKNSLSYCDELKYSETIDFEDISCCNRFSNVVCGLELFKIDCVRPLAEATGSATKWAHYLYDSGGDRVKKVVNKPGGIQEVTLYVDGIFEHTYKSTATVINSTKNYNTIHVMDGRSRIATKRIGTDEDDDTPSIKYNLEDHLGTSSVTLDFSGDLINREEYYPFGESSFGGFTKKRFRYVGKEKDNESGLYYYGARYYAPWMCRFISIDPLADKYAQLTPYNYADNNPIGDLDIDGMQNTQSGTAETVGDGPTESGIVTNKDGSINYDKSMFNIPEVVITGTSTATKKELEESATRISNYFDHMNNLEIEMIEAGEHWQLLNYSDNSPAKDWGEYYKAKEKFIEIWDGEGSLEQAFDNFYPHTQTYKREKEMQGRSLMNWGTWFAMALESGPGYTIKLQAPRGRINFKLGGEDALKVKLKDEMVSVYRGGDDFTLKPDEFRVTPNSPKYPARGLSVSADPTKLPKHLSVNKLTKAPKGLDFIHTPSKRDGLHFDIIPSDLKIGLHEFQKLLNQIKVTKQ